MADEDAEKERLINERRLRVAMSIDAACMHDTQLIDNCFFSKRNFVVAQAQTVAPQIIDRAISIMTPFTKSSLFGKKGPLTKISKGGADKTHKIYGNAGLDSDLDENTPREYMASDRQLIGATDKRRADLLINDVYEAGSSDGELDGMLNDLNDINSDSGHIRKIKKVESVDPAPKPKRRRKKRPGEDTATIS